MNEREWIDGDDAFAECLARRLTESNLAARVAVVRPTRDQLARTIAEAFYESPGTTAFPERAADALLAEFWPSAVSDSQETPT